MPYDKCDAIRRLVPKSYHFDGYNVVNCPNPRDKPFFADNVTTIGDHNLKTRLDDPNTLYIEYDSVCGNGIISFKPYKLTLDAFALMLQEAVQNGCDYVAIEIQPVFGGSARCYGCSQKNNDCSALMASRPRQLKAAISFDPTAMKKALAIYFGITNKKEQKIEGGTPMKNLLGKTYDFGRLKDPRIASTLFGVVVKSANGNWIKFDPKTNTRTDMASFTAGDFPIFALPAGEVKTSDLIRMEGKYYFVMKPPAGEKKTITVLDAETGVIQEMLPSTSFIPGLDFYTLVVAIDPNSLTNLSSKESMGGNALAAVLMMGWAQGGKDAVDFSFDNPGTDSFNGLGSIMPLLMVSNSGIFGGKFKGPNGMLSLSLLTSAFGGGEGGGSDGMQMLLLSQLLNGGTNGLSNLKLPGLTADEGEVKCPKCDKAFPADTKFCPECGTKTVPIIPASAEGEVKCPKCDKAFPADTKFCPECGTKTVSIPASTEGERFCPKCNKAQPANVKFCPDCGTETVAKATTCSKCKAELKPGAAFCHNCGQKVGKSICPKCGKTLEDGEKFCSECGTSRDAVKTEKPAKTARTATSGKKPVTEGTKTPAGSKKAAATGTKPDATAKV